MASFVWGRCPEEAYKNPYEHEANRQFATEAKEILDKFFKILMQKNMCFEKMDTSLAKAEWMLLTDSTDALIEALNLLEDKRHRITARLFRDVVENIDLLVFFHSNTSNAKKYLAKWFNREYIPHKIAREYLKSVDGEGARKQRAKYYGDLSAFTHRSYGALLKSYSLGCDDKMVFDTEFESRNRVLPNTTSAYYAAIGYLILQLSKALILSGLISIAESEKCWANAIQNKSVPRRFVEN